MFTKIKKKLGNVFSQNNVPPFISDDPTILYLLKYLNLSNCKIATLPKELGALPHLEKLVLSNNGFGTSDKFKWHWLQPTAIQNNLQFLDLSKNSLTELPACIGKLSALTELIVCHNLLTCLPQSIGNLLNLKFLRLSNNKFLYFPGSMINSMRLKILDVSANDLFLFNVTVINEPLLSLSSLAAKVMLKNRSTYSDRDIPFICLEYLEKAAYCLCCKNPIFESHIRRFVLLDPIFIADRTILDRDILCFEYYSCWPACCRCWRDYDHWIVNAIESGR